MSAPPKLRLPPGLLATQHDEAAVILGQLIEENHKKNALLYKGVLHNHIQHGLLAGYCLGSSAANLGEIFTEEAKELEPRKESENGEVLTEATVDEFLGRREHENEYVKYFEEQRATSSHDSQGILQYWLLDRQNQFLPGLIGGYAHPLVMLADSVELGSSVLLSDALALTAVDWNPLSRLITMDLPEPQIRPASLHGILDTIRKDVSFDKVVPSPGIEHITDILKHEVAEKAVLQYLSMGEVYLSNPDFNLEVTEEMVELAIHLLTCTHMPGVPAFDFYLNHNLTFVNCLRILLPVFGGVDAKQRLLRIYWLLTILAFITQGRPTVTPELLQSRTVTVSPTAWDKVKKGALGVEGAANPGKACDAHFLKAVQILHTVGSGMKALESMSLAAASKFEDEFIEWTGFGKSTLNITIDSQHEPM